MNKRILGAVAAVSLMMASAAMAAEPQGWKVEVTPYLWLFGIDGDVTLNGQETEFDRSAGDVLDGTDAGGSLLTVVQYDRFLFWGQVDFLSYDTDELDIEDRPEGGRFETDTVLGELAVGYQLDGWAEGQTFDILAGVRTLSMENTLTVYGVGTVERDDLDDDSDTDSRVDGILVVRPSIPVFPSKISGLRFNPTLGIGGGDSDLVYELQPQLQYQITEYVAARLGYRTVGYHIKGDNAKREDLNLTEDDELNIAFSGLIAGLGVTF